MVDCYLCEDLNKVINKYKYESVRIYKSGCEGLEMAFNNPIENSRNSSAALGENLCVLRG